MCALPFGAPRSAYAFLGTSYSLWFLLVKEFLILATNYFDDFVVLAEEVEMKAVAACVNMFFNLVGWDFAETRSKAPELAELFQALGVMINVSALHTGLVTVGNTDSPRQELLHILQAVVAAGRLSRHDALKLRGCLQFAAGNMCRRVARSFLAIITQHAYSSVSSKLDDRAVTALQLHVQMLQHSRPLMLALNLAMARSLQAWEQCF